MWMVMLSIHIISVGSTPLGCYKKLIEYFKNGEISFQYVKTFNMDEYVGKYTDWPFPLMVMNEQFHSWSGNPGRVILLYLLWYHVTGLPIDHPGSYHSVMWNNFFKHVDIKPENVHILDGSAADLQEECEAFEEKIEAAGGIRLFLGGGEVKLFDRVTVCCNPML